MRRADRGALLTALLLALGAPAFALDLTELAALLAQRKSGEARFTEERFVTGFDGPLLASGTLSYAAPDRFARRTTEPREESMVVEGNSIVLKRGGRTRQMAVDAVPELNVLIEAMRGTLMGDAPALRRHFHVQVDGAPTRWTLTLKPRDARLASLLHDIKITGQISDVRSVELWMSGGDRSLMSIEPAIGPAIEPRPSAPVRQAPK